LALSETIEKYNNDRDTVKEIFRLLLQSFEEEHLKIENARKNNDWETVAKIAHKQRGSASYCGIERFQQACSHLEDYIKSGATELREKLLNQMLEEAKFVEKEMVSIK
jgi:two-component system aerobic respiration control sensor histidine kinase ArcB